MKPSDDDDDVVKDVAIADLIGSDVPLTKIPTVMLRAVFDIAVNSMDFGSGFLDDEEVNILRATAVLLNVDPMEGTPGDFRTKFAHSFVQRPTPPWWNVETDGVYEDSPRSNGWRCDLCNAARDHPVHGGEGKLLGPPGSN